MKPERYRRIKEVFSAALERPEGERAAFVRDAAADGVFDQIVVTIEVEN